MRRFTRWLLVTVAFGLLLAIVAGVVGEFFIEWAREQGWYDDPSQRLDAAMSAVSAFVSQTWFIAVTAFFAGLALGVWLDLFLRSAERRKSPVGFFLCGHFPYVQERRGTWTDPNQI
jgi:hypothetical protein